MGAIRIGSRIGSYEILQILGKGGMGEVYRARDLKLKRDIAIKTLPDEFSRDPDRISRFQREAEALATLNHPNVAQIYGLEEASGQNCIVMELVEGETLQQRLTRGSIPVQESLQIAIQIADGLAAAHERGIVHRDLKPGNVVLSSDGKVKVLDFGLAKALDRNESPNLSNSPTIVTAGSAPGVILGTAGYMSPEQARGQNADQRSDVFAFGCVLFEMLSGHKAFPGETVSDILAFVLAREPDYGLVPPDLNPRAVEVLRRCLNKNHKKRWHAVADLGIEIEALLSTPLRAEPSLSEHRKPFWKRALPFVVTATTAVLVTSGITATFFQDLPSPSSVDAHVELVTPADHRFQPLGSLFGSISPDGTRLIYMGRDATANQLYLRSIVDTQHVPVAATRTSDGAAHHPVFSPDGQYFVYWWQPDYTLRKMSIHGGVAVRLCSANIPNGLRWDGNAIVYGQAGTGILRVSADGGEPEIIAKVSDGYVNDPQILPDNKGLLFSLSKGASAADWDQAQIVVQPQGSSERRVLFSGGSGARYLPSGHLVYWTAGKLMAVGLDLATLRPTGSPVAVIEDVAQGSRGIAQYTLSDTGTLIYQPASAGSRTNSSVIVLDRDGKTQTTQLTAANYIRVSPDGKTVATVMDANIWTYSRSGGVGRQVTVDGINRFPLWSRNGERIVFQSNREGDAGLFWRRADGTGPIERLTRADKGEMHIPDSWSADGKAFSYTVTASVSGSTAAIRIFNMDTKTSETLLETRSQSRSWSDFSPDGKWIVYQSNVSGQNHIYMEPFPPDGSTKLQVTVKESGTHPRWSADGTYLYFRQQTQLAAIQVRTKPTVEFGKAFVVLDRASLVQGGGPSGVRSWDVLPGDQVILITRDSESPSFHLEVVFNFFQRIQNALRGGEAK